MKEAFLISRIDAEQQLPADVRGIEDVPLKNKSLFVIGRISSEILSWVLRYRMSGITLICAPARQGMKFAFQVNLTSSGLVRVPKMVV